MLTFQRLLMLFLLPALIVPLLNCGTGHDADEKYFMIATNVQVPYWQTAKAGFNQAASLLKVRVEVAGPDSFDPKAEQDAFEKALGQKPTGILVSAGDAQLLKSSIDKAVAASVPVITIDSDAPDSKRLFFIGTNNYQAGVMGGKRLEREMHGKGNIVVFTMPEQANLQERLKGYKDALEGSSQIKFTRTVDIKGDPRVAFDTATEIIGKEKDKVDAFVCLEALAGKEVATVLNNNNVKNKIVMAMDTDADTVEWVQKGTILATISQKPYTMAYLGVMMLDRLYHHKIGNLDMKWSENSLAPIPAFVDTGASLVDKNNVEAFVQATKSATSGQK